jgi:predicted ArsR family transcriptional regulator
VPGKGDIPESVRRFLARYIDSIERFEILLLLQRDPARKWAADEVGAALGIAPSEADRHLTKLFAFNFLDVQIHQDLFYWYSPRPQHLDREARAAAEAYARGRLAVLRQILEAPPETVRDFAEAFRLTKRGESDG